MHTPLRAGVGSKLAAIAVRHCGLSIGLRSCPPRQAFNRTLRCGLRLPIFPAFCLLADADFVGAWKSLLCAATVRSEDSTTLAVAMANVVERRSSGGHCAAVDRGHRQRLQQRREPKSSSASPAAPPAVPLRAIALYVAVIVLFTVLQRMPLGVDGAVNPAPAGFNRTVYRCSQTCSASVCTEC